MDNRPGGSSTIGLDLAAKSPPDGHTWGANNITYGANPSLIRKMPFDSEKDLLPVSQVTVVNLVVALHPVGAGALDQGADRARQGAAGTAQLQLRRQRQREPPRHREVHEPDGDEHGARALQGRRPGGDLARRQGETSLLFATIPSSIDHIKGGRLQAIGVSRLQRSSGAARRADDSRIGRARSSRRSSGTASCCPPARRKRSIRRAHQALAKALAIPAVKERIVNVGAEVVGSSPEEFAAFLKSEYASWAKVMKEVGITVE